MDHLDQKILKFDYMVIGSGGLGLNNDSSQAHLYLHITMEEST